MKNKVKNALLFFRRPRSFILAAVLLVVALFFVFGSKKQTAASLVAIRRGSITQEVVVTGDITSSQNVDLSFLESGTVNRVAVATGDKVTTGQILLTEDSSILQAQLQQAEAAVAAAEANLAIVKNGATPEDISVSEAQVASAQSSLNDAEANAVSVVKDAYTKADDAVRNQTDPIFANPRSANPQLVFTIPDQQLSINLEGERVRRENDFAAWSAMMGTLNSASGLGSAIDQIKAYLNDIQKFLSDAASALNVASPSASIMVWKGTVAAGRTEVGTAITDVAATASALNSAEATLQVAQKQLALKRAPATPDRVAANEAAVAQAEANVSVIEAQIGQTVLRSPVKGIVTNVVPKKGELVTPGKIVVSIIGSNSLQIEAYVAEADVAKLVVGDKVDVTFDALPGENFTGRLLTIDPAQTIVNGVANYKIETDFDQIDPRFKSGLTANLAIETKRKDNILVIPQFAIAQNDQGTFATKMENGKEIQVPITLGIQDQNGNAEVTSGLQEGDRVVNIGLKP